MIERSITEAVWRFKTRKLIVVEDVYERTPEFYNGQGLTEQNGKNMSEQDYCDWMETRHPDWMIVKVELSKTGLVVKRVRPMKP